MSNDKTPRTPQEYEILTGGGAENAELARKSLSRRQFLRTGVGVGLGIFGAEAVALGLTFIYPFVTGSFGGKIKLSKKSNYPAALPQDFDMENGKGVFYESLAQSYIVHLAADTPWLMSGQQLADTLASEWIVQDSDGTFWLAIWQRCVHLGCKFNFNTDCHSFKCPCHGSHYNVDGEWLSGPAPRSNDRFQINVSGDTVVVDTGKLNNRTQHPSPTTLLLTELQVQFKCQ